MSLRALTPSHVARIRWNFDNDGGTPAGGFRDLTFPITVHEQVPFQRGWYHAMQWSFTGVGGGYPMAYTGIQPRPEGVAYTPFSMFGKGGEVVDTELCHGGADGGSGVTCNSRPGIEDFHVGREYLFTVEQDPEDQRLFRGWVTDPVTLEERTTGAWRIPAGYGGIRGYHVGFLEYYVRVDSCTALPYCRVTYGRPYSVSAGTMGQLRDPYEVSDKPCAGQSGFRWERDPDGSVTVELGRKRRTAPDPEPGRCDVDVTVDVQVALDTAGC